jgi:hypothetical protein
MLVALILLVVESWHHDAEWELLVFGDVVIFVIVIELSFSQLR